MEELDLKEVVRQNQELLSSLDKRLHKIEKHFRTEAILNVIKWLIIVVPIVFGIVYLSPYVKTYVGMIKPALQALNLDSINEMLGNDTDNAQAPVVNGLEILCDPVKRQAIINQNCK
ncbi:MAG: hypothetical protein WCV69_04255 [Patescibacteria group bacterium]|jgi:hypothetical protein